MSKKKETNLKNILQTLRKMVNGTNGFLGMKFKFKNANAGVVKRRNTADLRPATLETLGVQIPPPVRL